VELQGRVEQLKQQGLGLVAISYDSPDVLKRFSASRNITFPLIADLGSEIIRRYSLFNTNEKPGTRAYGIPFPGTFIVDRGAVVRARYFEDAYQERNTVASMLVRQGVTALGPVTTIQSAQLSVTAGVSDRLVAPGERVSMAFDVAPRRGVHVYAPGTHTYQVVRFTLDPQPWLRAHPTTYPPSTIYHFKPLDERVEVYEAPFRLVQDATILATPDIQKLLADLKTITLSGKLEYQACDDKVCYSPQTVRISWTLDLKPLDRQPPG
jgi:hypothetical protein